MLIGLMAPAGHTIEHSLHSVEQNPRSKTISGCIRLVSESDGFNTFSGHALTQSWHAVQWSVKFFTLRAPAGTTGVLPRSMFFFKPNLRSPAFVAILLESKIEDIMKVLRP